MKLRAAAVSFLNARPLTAGLAGSPRIDLVLAEPALCASMLDAGDVDLALLPVGALPGRDWEVVPGLGIGADGPVQTVVLAGEQPPETWDEVFLDTASRTSQILAQLVLRERGLTPRYLHLPALEGLARAVGTKGALVIGDRAFDVKKKVVLDLGREWNRVTKLPMVFAVWAARPGVLRPEDVQELARGAQVGLGMRTELAQEFARENGGDPEQYRRYLTQKIRYGLGPHELEGLETFLARAVGAGLVPPTRLRFADDVVRTRRIRAGRVGGHRAAEGRRRRAARRRRGRGPRREGPAARARAGRRRAPARAPPRGRRHLHRVAQHELHERVHDGLLVLRVLPPPQPRRGLRARPRPDGAEDRGDPGAGGHRGAPAGRPPPRPRHRVVRGPLPLGEDQLPAPSTCTPSRPRRSGTSPAPASSPSTPPSTGSSRAGSTRSRAAGPRCSTTRCGAASPPSSAPPTSGSR